MKADKMESGTLRLDGRIAVVTGASSEIGQAITYILAGAGARVVAGCYRSLADAECLVERIGKSGGQAVFCQGDLRRADEVDKLLDSAQECFGSRAEILVNGAAKKCSARLADIDPGEWDDVLRSCLTIAGLCSQGFVTRLGGRAGHIVNITSTAAFAPLPHSHHYVAAKGALDAVTRSLAMELAPRVQVNSVAPGYVATRSHTKLPPENLNAILQAIPLGKMPKPEDIAMTVLFLVASGVPITGQGIVVDGGWNLSHG